MRRCCRLRAFWATDCQDRSSVIGPSAEKTPVLVEDDEEEGLARLGLGIGRNPDRVYFISSMPSEQQIGEGRRMGKPVSIRD